MSDRSDAFDPYLEWLEIPPEDQPPSFYRLLGVPEFEPDSDVIDEAAKKRTAYLHPMSSGPERESVHRLLSEVAKARRTLLSAETKQAYDDRLRSDNSGDRDLDSQVESDSPNDSESFASPMIRIDTGDDAATRGSRNKQRTSKPSVKKRTEKRKSTSDASSTGKPSSPKKDRARKAASATSTDERRSNSDCPGRKKSWGNDWRVHAASIMTLLAAVIGFVIYTNSRDNRRAAAPMTQTTATSSDSAENSSTGSSRSAPARRSVAERASRRPTVQRNDRGKARSSGLKSSGAGKSSLALALEAQMKASGAENDTAPDAKQVEGEGKKPESQEKPKSQEKAEPKSKQGKSNNPKSSPVSLSPDWLQGVPAVVVVNESLEEAFEVRKLAEGLKVEESRIWIQPIAKPPRSGSLMAKEVSAGLGELISVETNLRKRLPNEMRVGLIVGPIRIRLVSKRGNLQVLVNEQTLGAIAPANGAKVRFAVLRDPEDAQTFRWIVQAGEKGLTGHAKMKQEVASSVPVGLLFSSPQKKFKNPIWFRDLRVGTLTKIPEFKSTELVTITPAT
ncbi:MAG: hypothetical protein ACR2NZ_03820 [Rubripirellula sp.]